jgi:hypothetical protein
MSKTPFYHFGGAEGIPVKQASERAGSAYPLSEVLLSVARHEKRVLETFDV